MTVKIFKTKKVNDETIVRYWCKSIIRPKNLYEFIGHQAYEMNCKNIDPYKWIVEIDGINYKMNSILDDYAMIVALKDMLYECK